VLGDAYASDDLRRLGLRPQPPVNLGVVSPPTLL
jgi:hypothetical protein